jgi:SAM-dependent methyltransferase
MDGRTVLHPEKVYHGNGRFADRMVSEDAANDGESGDEPPARDTYDDLAAGYDDITGAAIREHYEWPAVRELLPALDGRRVLDAACGDGFYTERLVAAGADAVGVDASPEMVARARRGLDEPPRPRLRRRRVRRARARARRPGPSRPSVRPGPN